jgi:phosphoglycolate phosphatase
MQFRGIIFDLDGTLLNTLDDIGSCVNHVLKKRGFPGHETSTYRYFIGDGAAMLFQRALPEKNRALDMVAACVKEFKEIYQKNGDSRTVLYSGIPELLDELTVRKTKKAILSNKPHELTVRSVKNLLTKWSFDLVLGQRDHAPRKPDPTGALEIAAHFDILPSEFLYLGDSSVDMKTAVSAGMFPVGALWGYREENELRENGARMLVNNPHEILELLF